MDNVKYKLVWQSGNEQEILRDYYSEKEVIDDIIWKDPCCYFVGDVSTGEGISIPDFLEKYDN